MDTETITLTLTKAEGQTLYELIDLAVKAGGVQAGKVAVPIVDKLMEAVNTAAQTATS